MSVRTAGELTVNAPSGFERALRHDRALVVIGLAAATLASWVYLASMSATMHATVTGKATHAVMGMPEMAAWSRVELLMLFTMWTVMMIAMMLPSASPLILLVAGTYRRRGDRAFGFTTMFAGGYLLAWTAFSALAATTQVVLHQASMLSPDMDSRSAIVGGGVLIAAGVYQWLPLKGACLTHCRSPLTFLTHEWREGRLGAVTMGVRHGVYCVGCCWALMALLFVVGVMNLLWVAALTVFVLAERLTPQGALLGRLAGIFLMAWGAWVLVQNSLPG